MKSTTEKKYNFSEKGNRGYRYLQEFMRNLSEKAKLSKIYTNHCIRVTRICDLDSEGHSVQEIMLVTGHKSESSVRRYLHKRRDRSLFKSSESVRAAMSRQIVSTSGTVSCTTAPEAEAVRVTPDAGKRMRIHVDGSANVIDFLFESTFLTFGSAFSDQ